MLKDKSKTQYIIRFNNNKYWGGFRSFVKHWWQAHAYASAKVAAREAEKIIKRRVKWYGNTELKAFDILEKESTLKPVVFSRTVDF